MRSNYLKINLFRILNPWPKVTEDMDGKISLIHI